MAGHLASPKHNFHHKAVELSTRGIIFLGTPHVGAEGVDFTSALLAVQSLCSNTDDTLLNEVRLHSKGLQQEQSRYTAISDNYVTKFCYELYGSELGGGVTTEIVTYTLKGSIVAC